MDLNFENKAKSELDRITLKAEKVELSTYSDLLNHNKTIKKELPNKQSDINNEFSTLRRRIKLALDFAETSVDTLQDDTQKFEKEIKELGMNPNDNNDYKDAIKTIAHAKEEVKYYNKALNAVKNFG
jgi:phosphoenolpyruvate carboxylase|tara:strand:+ start:125 stop:505 length:381 start_codon:yes stop_codon:yes gene_type:complete